jgi:hypothetical protein
VSYYGIVRTPWVVIGIALGAVTLETGLGGGLLIGRARTRCLLALVAGLLVFFSLLIAYAWAFQGLKDCGCFGKYLKMTPGVSILKNLILLALVWIAWRKRSLRVSEEEEWDTSSRGEIFWHVVVGGTAILAVVGSSIFSLNRAEARHNRLGRIESNAQSEVNSPAVSGTEEPHQAGESDKTRFETSEKDSSPNVALETDSELGFVSDVVEGRVKNLSLFC